MEGKENMEHSREYTKEELEALNEGGVEEGYCPSCGNNVDIEYFSCDEYSCFDYDALKNTYITENCNQCGRTFDLYMKVSGKHHPGIRDSSSLVNKTGMHLEEFVKTVFGTEILEKVKTGRRFVYINGKLVKFDKNFNNIRVEKNTSVYVMVVDNAEFDEDLFDVEF